VAAWFGRHGMPRPPVMRYASPYPWSRIVGRCLADG